MHDPSNPSSQWLDGLPVEDRRAAQRIFNECFDRLVTSAQRQLLAAPRGESDGEDLANSVLGSFFRGVSEGRISGRLSRPQLWGLMWTIARRKAANVHRRRQTLRRGAGRVHNETDLAAHHEGNGALPHSYPDAADGAALVELRDLLWKAVELLDDPVCERVLPMRLAGYSYAEIAAALDCSTRTVERKMQRVQRALADLDRDAESHESEAAAET